MNKARRGFTLIELLAASLLSAMLAIAVLAVISSLGRSNRAMAAAVQLDRFPQSLVDMVRFDLINGRQVTTEVNSIVIKGYSQLDPNSGEPTHRAGVVRYAVRKADRRRWLVRIQQEPGKPAMPELVCADVAGIEIHPMGGTSVGFGAPSTQPTARPAEVNLVPAQVVLIVRPDDPGVPVLFKELTLR